ncbi:hypothetical protein NIES4072_68050 [Nostoc commune NIES-4072]|uniref:Uncharacterized protein n=1 Tax=Nostoc commune NIES-4072 TaxID=2005467 RepID=A0A2R5G3T4_NOSCO|nr:hypothetical protein [Nostoc commune]BBD70439.1 hypothetical protein NIES4070_68500 [Nostoc commune HK-02]GBG23093.1 hypothetical protein NIES4072_68050 [Nostoc commune NIES-4072]
MNPQENAEILAALMRQEELLKQLVAAINKPKLGLHSEAGSCKIYCNRHNGSLWYTLSNNEVTAIASTALTGYLRELKFEKCERRSKEVYKLLATIQADRTYILESGHDTHFTKSILAAIATLTPEQLYSPITLQPTPGTTDENVLFCRVWVESELVMASYNEQSDWREISKQAIAVTKAAAEMVF